MTFQQEKLHTWQTVLMNSLYDPTPQVVDEHTHTSSFSLTGGCGPVNGVVSWTVLSGTLLENQVSVKIRAQHSLIFLGAVILALILSNLFSRDRRDRRRLGSGGQLAQAFSQARGPPLALLFVTVSEALSLVHSSSVLWDFPGSGDGGCGSEQWVD